MASETMKNSESDYADALRDLSGKNEELDYYLDATEICLKAIHMGTRALLKQQTEHVGEDAVKFAIDTHLKMAGLYLRSLFIINEYEREDWKVNGLMAGFTKGMVEHNLKAIELQTQLSINNQSLNIKQD